MTSINSYTDSGIKNLSSDSSTVPFRTMMKRILSSPNAIKEIPKIPPTELYYLIKGIGLQDSAELIEFTSAEQLVFCIDMDVWDKWLPSADYLYEWVQVLLEGDEERTVVKLKSIDPELLIYMLKQEIKVSGGVQVLNNPEEFQPEWDQTLDDIYYLSFLNKEHSQVISRFLESTMKYDNELYVTLLEGVIDSSVSELQEASYQFRTARLADYGFPDYESALSVFSYVDPGSYSGSLNEVPFESGVYDYLPVPIPDDDLFVSLIRGNKSPRYSELMILFNNVIVAEGKHPDDAEEIEALFRRVCGIMSIAIEYRCGRDMKKYAEFLDSSTFADIFRIGFSILVQLKRMAEKSVSAGIKGNLAYRRAVEGLLKRVPLFYKGFDDDLLDDYREFRSLDDVNKVRDLLSV